MIDRRFSNRCAAVATAEENGRWAWGIGYADSRAAAVERADTECRNEGVGVCRLYDSICAPQM